jgi:hypothetical protein
MNEGVGHTGTEKLHCFRYAPYLSAFHCISGRREHVSET